MRKTILLVTLILPLFAIAQQDTARVKMMDFDIMKEPKPEYKDTHVIIYDPKTNETRVECYYLNGRRNGLWVVYNNKKVWRQESYKDGAKDGVFLVNNDNGSPERKEVYKEGSFISGQCYTDGIEVPYFKEPVMYAEVMPKPSVQIEKYFKENLKYPQSARDSGIKGRVIVKFIVREDGSIFNPVVVKGFDSACDAEAIRLIKSLPSWAPGIIHKQNVSVYMALPVDFQL